MYLEQLPYPPYAVQEEALLTWFTHDKGVLVCAPTGTGKTLIAQAALFEALHTGTVAYYTTPLIALTEQKFAEMQEAAVRWGFRAEDVGLVTGNRKVNPDARVLVVVAEILLNRLLTPEGPEFKRVSAVVMDEFHSFADPERGIVWELSLAMLPAHVRLLLLSATVGNAYEFTAWLRRCHDRDIELVQGTERKIPLTYRWVDDNLLGEQMVEMAEGDAATRKTPALVFCFNRDECWSVAEQLKGLPLLGADQKGPLHEAVNALDWKTGVGPKIKAMLHRGVGVHHAGLLPKYRRAVEELFVKKLLACVVCTETLAAGINLPARSVVLTSLVKGPPGGMKIIDASTAHQIFGRAGRPQFDKEGFVYALAHEDDVKILRWKKKYDQIPENTKDPGLLKAKKELKRKKPERNSKWTYWNEEQFAKLQAAPPGKLFSKGPMPWRLLAYLLKASPEVAKVRAVIRKRLMDAPRIAAGEKTLDRMLLTLAAGGYVELEPKPPEPQARPEDGEASPTSASPTPASAAPSLAEMMGRKGATETPKPVEPAYSAVLAKPTPALDTLLAFRSVHPLYGAFLIQHLGIANREERIQAMESVLEVPRPMLRHLRVPWPEDLPPGPLAAKIDPELIAKGLIAAPVAPGEADDEDDAEEVDPYDWRNRPPTLADKLRLLFDATVAGVEDVQTQSVWCAGELLRYGGDFNKYVTSRDMTKQEGIVFRHLMRLILLCGEFAKLDPPGTDSGKWRDDLRDLAEQLTASCRAVDPASTDEIIERERAAAEALDVLPGREPPATVTVLPRERVGAEDDVVRIPRGDGDQWSVAGGRSEAPAKPTKPPEPEVPFGIGVLDAPAPAAGAEPSRPAAAAPAAEPSEPKPARPEKPPEPDEPFGAGL
jgi:superfamily II DNA/RNA helicase